MDTETFFAPATLPTASLPVAAAPSATGSATTAWADHADGGDVVDSVTDALRALTDLLDRADHLPGPVVADSAAAWRALAALARALV